MNTITLIAGHKIAVALVLVSNSHGEIKTTALAPEARYVFTIATNIISWHPIHSITTT